MFHINFRSSLASEHENFRHHHLRYLSRRLEKSRRRSATSVQLSRKQFFFISDVFDAIMSS